MFFQKVVVIIVLFLAAPPAAPGRAHLVRAGRDAVLQPGHPPDPPRVYIIEGFLPPFLPLLPLPGATTATTSTDSTDSTDSESPHCTEDPERRSPVKSLHGCALHLHKKYKLRNNILVHNGCKARGREVTGSRGSPPHITGMNNYSHDLLFVLTPGCHRFHWCSI